MTDRGNSEDEGMTPSGRRDGPHWGKPSERFNRFDVKALAIAVRLHRAGDLHQAAEAYNEILKAHPDEPDVLHLLGLVFAEAGQSARAIGLIERAIRFSPDQEAFHNSLGTMQRDTGAFDLAIQSFQRAFKINPRADEALENLGECLDRAGRRADAIALFRERCAQKDPPIAIGAHLTRWIAESKDAASPAGTRECTSQIDNGANPEGQ